MNWVSQISVAFHLLNNAALLAVGTLGYCGLRRQVRDRLPSWAQTLLYGALFGALGILTACAPAVSGIAVSLRYTPLIVATLFCGPLSGALAALVQIVGSIYVLADNPALGVVWMTLLCLVLSTAYRLLLLPQGAPPRLRDLAIIGPACVFSLLGMGAWLWGLARLESSFAAVGPAWSLLFAFTVVALGAIIRHVERNDALASAVAENERRFRTFYNESPVMLTAIDREERIVAASDRWLEVMGYSREEVIGRSRYEVLAPSSASRVRQEVLAALREGRPIPQLELQLRRKDGRLVDVSATSVLRHDPVTGGEEILTFAIDQTARKQAERALSESQELLIEAQRLGRVGHIFVDRIAKRVRWSDSVFEMRGIPRRESFGFEEAIAYIHPDDRSRYEAVRDAAIAEHRDFEVDMRVFRGDGTFGWEHSIGRPRYDAEGKLTGILVVLRDVTESKRAEEALKSKKADLRAVLDNAPFAIFLKDCEGRYRLVNRRYTEWFGAGPEELYGRTTAEAHPAAVAAAGAAASAEVLRQGRVTVVERPPLSARTKIGYLQITQFPIRDERGEIVGCAGFCADIGERKRAERALAESRDLLLESQRLGGVGYILSDLVNDRVYWSDSLFELRRVPRRAFFTFEETLHYLHPEDLAEYMRARNAAVAERRDYEIDARVRRGDGTIAWEHSVGHPRYDEAGKCIGVLVVLRDITEEKRAEQVRRESRELLIQSQRLGKIGHLVSDRRSGRAYWSDTLFELRGIPKREYFTLEETEGTPFIHPADRASFLAARDAGIAERRDFAVDIRVERPGGAYAWESVIGRPRYDESGELTSVLYVLQDITERKRADEALRHKEAELRAIMDNAPLSIFLKDREGRYLLVNRRYGEWMQRTPEQIHGRTSDEVFPPEVARGMLRRDREVLEHGTVSNVEVATDFLDNELGVDYVMVTKFPVRDDAGEIMGIAGFAMDISARKRAEMALRETQGRLQAIMDNAPFAIFLKDREGRYQLINRTYTDWFGDRPQDVVGRTAAEVFPSEQARRWEESDLELMATGRVAEEERPVYSGRPGIDYVRSTKFPIRDDRGTIVGVAGFIADITARERAERTLHETQHWLQAIMDNAPFAIFLKDREGRYQLINRAYTDWFGDRPENVVGRTACEIYPSEQVQRWEAVDRELMRTGRVAHEERRVMKAKPGIEWVFTTKFPIRDEQGNSIGFAGIVDDITSRKRAQVALDESRRLLLESQRLGKLAYILSDAVHDRVVWSDSLFELRGVPRRESFTFEEAREFIHPEDRPKYLAAREAALAERRDFEFDVRARHGDGSYGWEHSIVHFQFDEAGTCLGSLALVQDISERKQAEQALRHSEERFRRLIEHSNDIVTVAARDGSITYRSPSSTEVMGYRDVEMVGQSIFDRVHPDDIDSIKRSFASLAGNPALRARGRSRVRHQDGSWHTLEWSARDASGVPGVEGIIVNSRDVTEALQLEEQLRESQKMEAVGQLAGGIAHDFNNILGAILGFAGFLLQDLPKDSPEHGFAERIVAASERGKELVRQILAFSRRSAVERKPTDLAQLMGETRELVRASLPATTALEMTLPEAHLIGDVNAAQINQILFNLCLNANDALQGEPGRIAVGLARIPAGEADRRLLGKATSVGDDDADTGRIVVGALRPDRAYACITVADSGSGMAPEVLKRIFDPFFTTKGRGRGTGLGLSVVHGIVMAYEGALHVTSRPGAGSVFNVYLPLVDVAAEAVPASRPFGRLGGRERVLVVDDEAVMTDVLVMALDRLGYEAVALNDPEEAINTFAENPAAWDVVISDQVMPGMKGLALLDRLKAIHPSLRFILYTGFSDGATEEGALAAGVDAFLLKPAAPEDIAAAIRRLFDRPATAAPAV
jgi:PAS domain S-box-containing protein